MAIYLGDKEKVKLTLAGKLYNLMLNIKTTPVVNDRLLSADGLVLTDINGTYLVPKKEA